RDHERECHQGGQNQGTSNHLHLVTPLRSSGLSNRGSFFPGTVECQDTGSAAFSIRVAQGSACVSALEGSVAARVRLENSRDEAMHGCVDADFATDSHDGAAQPWQLEVAASF